MFFVILGIGAVCCGLPAFGLVVAAVGATAGLLTGVLWVVLGAVGAGAMLIALRVARWRRAAVQASGAEAQVSPRTSEEDLFVEEY